MVVPRQCPIFNQVISLPAVSGMVLPVVPERCCMHRWMICCTVEGTELLPVLPVVRTTTSIQYYLLGVGQIPTEFTTLSSVWTHKYFDYPRVGLLELNKKIIYRNDNFAFPRSCQTSIECRKFVAF